MLKTTFKLRLNKEVLRTLVDKELERAHGGSDLVLGCRKTYAGSGCSSYGIKCYNEP